jgi:hypothetical protein
MKLAFYIEPYRIYHSSFYTYKLLYDMFINNGHTMHFYTPIDYLLDSISDKTKQMKVSDIINVYDINFKIQIPKAQEYDVLLLETQIYKKWCDINKDMRYIIAKKFLENNKNVIVIADSTFIETRVINMDNIMYGTK